MVSVLNRRRLLPLVVFAAIVVFYQHWASFGKVWTSTLDAGWSSAEPEADHRSQRQQPDKQESQSRLVELELHSGSLPPTTVTRHVPGCTIFDNLYMQDGTFFIVSDDPSQFPQLRNVISTPMEITGENWKQREPTSKVMAHLSLEDAAKRWEDRVLRMQGVTWLVQDVAQFVRHYYHFAAETFLRMWRVYASLDADIGIRGETILEQPSRILFPNCEPEEWRGNLMLNRLLLQASFPSISIETDDQWSGMVQLSRSSSPTKREKVWRFDRILIEDGSAAYRDKLAPATGRVSAEAIENTREMSSMWWWEPIRRAFARNAGVEEADLDRNLLMKEVSADENGLVTFKSQSDRQGIVQSMPIVVTYIVRRGETRVLHDEDHQALVDGLSALCKRRQWELNVVLAERLGWDEQIRIAARTTLMLGVHGNGLTHSLWMPRTPISAVFEIQHPGVFMNHYEWTVRRALGFRHYSFWNDTVITLPKTDKVIDGGGIDWHSLKHPSHPPTILKCIEEHVDGRVE